MDIVIVAQYLRNIGKFEGNNSRFVYLAKMIAKEGYNIEIITSNFSHGTKEHFSSIGSLDGIKVTAIEEPGYPKNICLRRFISHKVLARNIKSYLSKRQKPDVIFAAVPSLAVAEVCADYCEKNNVRFIVDIQDLWPEAFKMVIKIPIVRDTCFYPMKKQADKIYARADEIVAVSETYAKRGMMTNHRCKEPTVVYLGTEKDTFDKYAIKEARIDNEIIVSYIGSLAASYDLETVIDAISKIKTPIKLLVMGDGAYKNRIKNYSIEKKIKVEFTGLLEYPEMVKKLVNSDIAVNPIHRGSAGSIINKVNDYAMAGLPVINTQESSEYRELLEEYQAGINCECENSEEVYKALVELIENKEMRHAMGMNSRRLGEEKIDRAVSYQNIIALIVS